jgi:hypothetical protein
MEPLLLQYDLAILSIHDSIELFPSLVCQSLARGLASNVLAGGVLAACHSNGAVTKVSRGILILRVNYC